MIRTTLIISVLTFVFILFQPASNTVTGPGAAKADLLQCMESCIRHEGGNSAANKDTCKMRCANVPSATGRPGPGKKDSGSCMSAYKDCQANCGKNKKCKRVCKQGLMRCQ